MVHSDGAPWTPSTSIYTPTVTLALTSHCPNLPRERCSSIASSKVRSISHLITVCVACNSSKEIDCITLGNLIDPNFPHSPRWSKWKGYFLLEKLAISASVTNLQLKLGHGWHTFSPSDTERNWDTPKRKVSFDSSFFTGQIGKVKNNWTPKGRTGCFLLLE